VVSVDREGNIYWNDLQVPSAAALLERLKKESVKLPQPEVHIRGDGAARYESVGRIIFACQQAGISKVAFVTEPPPRN
jgi:biopolymer transport protein ExbD